MLGIDNQRFFKIGIRLCRSRIKANPSEPLYITLDPCMGKAFPADPVVVSAVNHAVTAYHARRYAERTRHSCHCGGEIDAVSALGFYKIAYKLLALRNIAGNKGLGVKLGIFKVTFKRTGLFVIGVDFKGKALGKHYDPV